MKPLVINFTPTGMIPQKDKVPSVPIGAAEIVEQVHAAWELGITMAHVHARKADGTPSSEAADYAPILEGIRRHCPDLVICASLSGRSVSDPAARAEVLSLKPDMGSLTLSSLNFVQQASINSPETVRDLAFRMRESGSMPELEVFDPGMVNYLGYLIRKGLVQAPYYVNLIVGNIAGSQLIPAHLAALVSDLPAGAHIALGGIGAQQLDAHLVALGLGWGIRVGLEDNIYWDRAATRITENLALLDRIHGLAELAQRPVMLPSELGNAGFYHRDRHAG
ncbi:MAG: hypothetical protein RJA19_373 [Bacteroidota bacterium]